MTKILYNGGYLEQPGLEVTSELAPELGSCDGGRLASHSSLEVWIVSGEQGSFAFTLSPSEVLFGAK